jgi:hypothetical protein
MRLVCFGDSWTAGHGIETDITYKETHYLKLIYTKTKGTKFMA